MPVEEIQSDITLAFKDVKSDILRRIGDKILSWYGRIAFRHGLHNITGDVSKEILTMIVMRLTMEDFKKLKDELRKNDKDTN
jgi:hypothetical protein